jgi:hypothetical protein
MLFRFGQGPGELSIGGIAVDAAGEPFGAGTRHAEVTLTFWAEDAERLIHPGDEFVVWYGRDVGRGRISGVASPRT